MYCIFTSMCGYVNTGLPLCKACTVHKSPMCMYTKKCTYAAGNVVVNDVSKIQHVKMYCFKYFGIVLTNGLKGRTMSSAADNG